MVTDKKKNPYDKKPKDIGLVMGTKEEGIWIDVKKGLLNDIENNEKALMISKSFLELAEQKITEEKKKHLNNQKE